jgi:DNA-directed RNA polymerase specialized sigma24 family protein
MVESNSQRYDVQDMHSGQGSRKRDPALTQDAFDGLLAWFDSNREQAGKKYEDIRRRLIKIFTSRGCLVAEDLADETINRVAGKVHELAADYTGDPALYFYGVAKRVFQEYLKKSATPPPPPPPVELPENVEHEHFCLEKCIERLTQQNRDIVLGYYKEERQAKIDYRKIIAEKLGITTSALRIRAHRIRLTLHECIVRCLNEAEN